MRGAFTMTCFGMRKNKQKIKDKTQKHKKMFACKQDPVNGDFQINKHVSQTLINPHTKTEKEEKDKKIITKNVRSTSVALSLLLLVPRNPWQELQHAVIGGQSLPKYFSCFRQRRSFELPRRPVSSDQREKI
jgi:hypothetical protein